MLIGLFVDYMIQIYRRFEECYRLDGNRLQALERTLTGTGKAILSGALTTALSFFSVVVTSFRGMHELGVVAGFGILFCLLATLVLMTSLFPGWPRAGPMCLPAGRPADLGASWAAGLSSGEGRHSSRASPCCSSWELAALRGSDSTRPWSPWGSGRAPCRRRRRRSQQVLGRRGEPLFVVARARERIGCASTSMRWRSKASAGGRVAGWAASPPRGCFFLRRPCSGKPWRASPPRV